MSSQNDMTAEEYALFRLNAFGRMVEEETMTALEKQGVSLRAIRNPFHDFVEIECTGFGRGDPAYMLGSSDENSGDR